ncbi:glycosyltransferase family 2 protein [Brachybacterium alimentarium]|uniref:glycosyltransferase family 2 protein n=1 Tax=Brachybacterium alimentarium TaxID=47845 RepID=UPI003FD3F61F
MAHPLVSVIIPVYNVETYLRATLDSTLEQGLTSAQMEVIAVNDGSTDRSGEILDEYRDSHASIRVIHQKPSGGPGGPRNTGIEAARGKYLFFLDSDDLLTENALRDMIEVAEAEGSEVLLAKPEGLNGRRVATVMFKKSKMDAHPVDDQLFRALSPWKLFSASLVHRKNIRFPVGMKVGEDQPFVACAYLNASKISILADRTYYLLRAREDGTNITSSRLSSGDYMDLSEQLVGTIVRETDAGALRDGFLRRPMRNALRRVIDARFLELSHVERQSIVRRIHNLLDAVYTEPVAAHLSGTDRLKMDCAVSGDARTLSSLVEWEHEESVRHIRHDGSNFRLDLPDALEHVGNTSNTVVPTPAAILRLTALQAHGCAVDIAGRASVMGSNTRPSRIAVRLSSRGSEAAILLPVTEVQSVDAPDAAGVSFRVKIDANSLPEAVWDMYVVQYYGDEEVVKRLGAARAEEIDKKPLYLSQGGQTVGAVYFTKGSGNIAFDVGLNLLPRTLADSRLVGIVPSVDAVLFLLEVRSRSEALVELRSERGGLISGNSSFRALSQDLWAYTVPWIDIVSDEPMRLVVKNESGEAVARVSAELRPMKYPDGDRVELAGDGYLVRKQGASQNSESAPGWLRSLLRRFVG